MKERTKDSISLGVVTAIVVGLMAMVMLVIQGDPCDSANDPEQCRITFPER
jgi:hypothetical protein